VGGVYDTGCIADDGGSQHPEEMMADLRQVMMIDE
jgi:hypothetical protein